MNDNWVDVGDEVPDFSLESQVGSISFHSAIEGQWGLLVTFRSSFDPVTASEIGVLSKLTDELEARRITLMTVGVDNGK